MPLLRKALKLWTRDRGLIGSKFDIHHGYTTTNTDVSIHRSRSVWDESTITTTHTYIMCKREREREWYQKESAAAIRSLKVVLNSKDCQKKKKIVWTRCSEKLNENIFLFFVVQRNAFGRPQNKRDSLYLRPRGRFVAHWPPPPFCGPLLWSIYSHFVRL